MKPFPLYIKKRFENSQLIAVFSSYLYVPIASDLSVIFTTLTQDCNHATDSKITKKQK